MLATAACLATHAIAEKAPRSLSELQTSDLIVVGTITHIRIESEPSRIERGLGNRDWGIYVTLAVEKVERGHFSDTEIKFRCYRVRYRRSFIEYFSANGHSPIPGTGTTIRAYLDGEPPHWSAVYPNGITAPDANEYTTFWANRNLSSAAELAGLRGRMFTYFLPLELWGLLLVVGVPLTVLGAVIARQRTIRSRPRPKERCHAETEEKHCQ